MKQTLTYQPHTYGAHTCRLKVEGFPDVSTGQGLDAVGILTGWTLDWVGHPQLEGRREHLQALMATVIPYARHLLSGVPRLQGGGDCPVSIGPDADGGHHMQLRSSQPDTPPLELHLDDAELADLVRVLDQCRLDPRMQLPLAVPDPQPLPARELRHRLPLRRRLAAPLGGVAALAMAAGVSTLLPIPRPPGATPRAAQSSRPKPQQPAAVQPPSAPSTAASTPTDARLQQLRGWLLLQDRSGGKTLATPQTWQLAVTPQGAVVAATPVEGNSGTDRASLGLPAAPVSSTTPGREPLLVRGVLNSSGVWELSPWHGW
jgi:hypothetical protein